MSFVIFVKVPGLSCVLAVIVTVKRICEFVQNKLKLHHVIRYVLLEIPYSALWK